MLFFALCFMMLATATAAARIPVKGVLEGICHMYCERYFISQEAMVCILYQSIRKKSIKNIPSFVCIYDICYKI